MQGFQRRLCYFLALLPTFLHCFLALLVGILKAGFTLPYLVERNARILAFVI